jgi:L-aminopeptidase/D-esterase-like protein
MGGKGENGSGDIFVAFSTANPRIAYATGTPSLVMLPNERVSALFTATVQATEEAIVNAMLGADTMTGAGYRRVYALPLDRLRQAMSKYGRPLLR